MIGATVGELQLIGKPLSMESHAKYAAAQTLPTHVAMAKAKAPKKTRELALSPLDSSSFIDDIQTGDPGIVAVSGADIEEFAERKPEDERREECHPQNNGEPVDGVPFDHGRPVGGRNLLWVTVPFRVRRL